MHVHACCSDNKQTYVLAAADANKALSWISSLQEKRGDFIKVSSALEETALEQEKDKKTLRPSKPVGALALTDGEEDQAQRSPTTVRKIVRSKLRFVLQWGAWCSGDCPCWLLVSDYTAYEGGRG